MPYNFSQLIPNVQDANQLPMTSKDTKGAISASDEVNVSDWLSALFCDYSLNLQGAGEGAVPRRNVIKSWNTLVTEDEEKEKSCPNCGS